MGYLLAVLAAALIIAGIAFIYWPAALIGAGAALALVAWYVDFDRKDAHETP